MRFPLLRPSSLAVAGALVAACSQGCTQSTEREGQVDPHSPLGRSLAAVAKLPLDLEVGPRQNTGGIEEGDIPDDYDYPPDPVQPSQPSRNFGDTDSGGQVVSGLSAGLTGTAAGNGGVGSPTAAGNGGVGSPTAAGNGGVPYSGQNVPSGGVAVGPSSESLATFATVFCDFLGSICISISRCSSEGDEDACSFDRGQCSNLVQDLLRESSTPIYISSSAIQAIRCIGSAIESECIFAYQNSAAIEARYRACGLIVSSESSGIPSDD